MQHSNQNREAWQLLLQDLDERLDRARAMGGAEKVAKQHARGRMTARERVAALCDSDSFSEYGALAGGSHPGIRPVRIGSTPDPPPAQTQQAYVPKEVPRRVP